MTDAPSIKRYTLDEIRHMLNTGTAPKDMREAMSDMVRVAESLDISSWLLGISVGSAMTTLRFGHEPHEAPKQLMLSLSKMLGAEKNLLPANLSLAGTILTWYVMHGRIPSTQEANTLAAITDKWAESEPDPE